MKYAIVIEKAPSNYFAYAPDLPGCVAVGETLEEVEIRMLETIEFHLYGLRQEGFSIPAPTSIGKMLELR